MNGGGGGAGVVREYDLCEMEEDALANAADTTSSSSSNGTRTPAMDTMSTSSGTTAILAHDDLLLDSASENGSAGLTPVAALKPALIKQNGTSKLMSVVHSYNYTGKHGPGVREI